MSLTRTTEQPFECLDWITCGKMHLACTRISFWMHLLLVLSMTQPVRFSHNIIVVVIVIIITITVVVIKIIVVFIITFGIIICEHFLFASVIS